MAEEHSRRRARGELLAEIRQLKEKVHKLEESRSASPAQASAKPEGLAEGIAEALGKMVPGLGGLIKSASQMPEFQQRLAAIDEQIKRKFKEQPLGRASLGLSSNLGHRQMGIPPSVRRGKPGRSAASGGGEGQGVSKSGPRGKYRQDPSPKVHISPETPAELPVDVFDEGGEIIVLAEAPGLNVEDIRVCLEGRSLVLFGEAIHRRGVQRIELPCDVVGEPEMSLANGILRIHIRKAAAQ